MDDAVDGDRGESDVGCGGEECVKCGVSQRCNTSSDCRTNACIGEQCVAAGCDDMMVGGDETGLNCGGSTCPPCTLGERCQTGGDCQSGVCLCDGESCENQHCSTIACGDGIRGPDEEGVDCGGSCPKPCDLLAACEDREQTFAETDVDCGGGTCRPCALGSGCLEGRDCESATCVDLECVVDPCPDSTAPCEPDGAGGMGSGGAPDPGTGGTGAVTGAGGTAGGGGTQVTGSGGTSNGGSEQGGTGGSSGGGGTGGGAGMAGGGMAGGGMAGAGMGGSAGGGTGPLDSCTGCARLSVPLAAANHKANYVIVLPSVMNFEAAEIRYRVYREAGSGGTIKGYIQHSGSPDFQQLFQSDALPIESVSGWTELTWDVAAQEASFDKTIVGRVGFQIIGADATSWTNPTVLYLDSITVTGVSAGPWNFNTSASIVTGSPTTANPNLLWLNAGDGPVAGSSVEWFE